MILLTLRKDSLVSSQVYEIIKTIYSSPDSSTSAETRISVLQNTLGQLRLANIATLDALTTHFTRLIDLTSADEAYISALATNLSPCVLRPRTDNSLTMHEKHAYRLIRDLFAHKEAIFGELKRASALSHTPSGGNASNAARVRAISTDESNRRANMEARNRAIASKSRNSSPAPHANGGRNHRRDRSSDPPSTRFPIHTSPPAGEGRRNQIRASLEVPENGSPATAKTSSTIPEHFSVTSDGTSPSSGYIADTNSVMSAPSEDNNGTFSEKRDSLGRSSRFPPRKTGGQGSLGTNRMSGGTNPRDSVGTEDGSEHRGVQLSDKPMDD